MPAQQKKPQDQPMSLEELARRMMAMPPKTHAQMVKKKAKPHRKK